MGDEKIRPTRVFISRAGAEAAFAIEIAAALRAQGVETVLQDENFGHQNFLAAMDDGLRDPATRVLALISPEWIASQDCRAEGLAALGGDTLNRAERLIPILVAPTALDGLFTSIAYVNVVHERRLGETAAAVKKALAACGFGEKPRPEEKARAQILHPQIVKQPGFTGRAPEMAAIAGFLSAEGGAIAAITAVAGGAGIGKTTLAKEYAWRQRAQYHGVWWIAAVSREGLREGLISLGATEMTGLDQEQDREAAAARAVRWVEASGADRPWLLILDNVNDPADLDGLLPRENAHVILTSRRSDFDRIAAPLPLDVLPADVATEYLCAEAAREDRDGAAALAETLGRLPLALEQAAAYLKRVRTLSFADYESEAARHLAKPHREDENAGVAATLTLAVAQVEGENAEAVRLLELMSFCAPAAIPLDLFVGAGRDLESVGEQAAALARWSLIRQAPLADGTPGADVHRLTQATGRARGGDARRDEALALLYVAIPDGEGADRPQDPRAWPRLRRLDAHGRAALAHGPEEAAAWQAAETAAGQAAAIANQLGVFAFARGLYAEAEPLFRRALAIREAALGPDHRDVAQSLNNLAELLRTRGALDASEPLHRRALAIREATLGPEHPDVALSLNNLAALLRTRGALDEAEPLHRRALAIREAALGPEHRHVAASLNNLAELLRAREALDAAEPLYRRALAIWEAALGPEHPDVAASLNNLAELLRARGALDAAEPLYRRALAIDEAALGPEHRHVATSLNNLALLLQARGAPDVAEPLYRRALAILEAALGPEHPDVASSLNNLAGLLVRRGEFQEAKPLYRRALAIFEAALPAAHPLIATARDNLAALEREMAGGAPAASEASPERTPDPPPLAKPKRRRGLLARLFRRDRAG